MEEAKTQLVPDEALRGRLPDARLETVAGRLIPLPVARPSKRRRAIVELGAQLDAICAKATRSPDVTGTYDMPELVEAPAAVLVTIEPWPAPAPPPPRPSLTPVRLEAVRAHRPTARSSRLETALLYGSVSVATFLCTIAAFY